HIVLRSYWIPGSYAPTWSEKHTSLFKAIEKEGLQGEKGDNNWVVRQRQIHDPGIQQEPPNINGVRTNGECRSLHICFEGETHYANRHDWSWTHGREYDTAAAQGRSSVRGLRQVAASRAGAGRGQSRWVRLARGLCHEAHEAAGGLVDGARGGRGQHDRG